MQAGRQDHVSIEQGKTTMQHFSKCSYTGNQSCLMLSTVHLLYDELLFKLYMLVFIIVKYKSELLFKTLPLILQVKGTYFLISTSEQRDRPAFTLVLFQPCTQINSHLFFFLSLPYNPWLHVLEKHPDQGSFITRWKKKKKAVLRKW